MPTSKTSSQKWTSRRSITRLNQARKELIPGSVEETRKPNHSEPDKIVLIADDGAHFESAAGNRHRQTVRRGVDLRNIEQEDRHLIVCAARRGIEGQARPRRQQSQRKLSGDQIPGLQSAEPVAGPADSSPEKEETTCKL
jgi:hypothetical protein